MSLDQASFRLGDRLVFENTSWMMQSDENWAITGRNGSGKSLLGDALRGRLPLVKGELSYHFKLEPGFTAEECIGHIAFEDRKGAIHEQVVQSRWHSFEQEQGQTVGEWLSYESVMEVNPFEVTDLHKRQRPRFERRRRRAVKLLGLERLLDRKLMVLANGEMQKAQLARVLSLPLKLVILDEPFIGLDRESRSHFEKVLNALMAGPLRVILITVNPESLPRGITHVMRVDDCRIVGINLLSRNNAIGPALPPESGPMADSRKPQKSEATWETVKTVKLISRSSHTPLKQGVNEIERDSHRTPNTLKGGHQASSTRNEELIRMRNVTVSYGEITILRNINWTIRAGESWALLGPNGSGKTTLLSMISGDHPQAYSNDITAFGCQRGEGEGIQDLKKQIGWVSPELQVCFRDSCTCLETVESGFQETIGLYEDVTPAQGRAARRWLSRFGLASFADTPLFELSAGLQRTALLARALVKRPRLLILDEPCQGLDPEHQSLVLKMLDSILRTGKETAIYVTHRPEEIPSSIKRLLRLKNGRVFAEVKSTKRLKVCRESMFR